MLLRIPVFLRPFSPDLERHDRRTSRVGRVFGSPPLGVRFQHASRGEEADIAAQLVPESDTYNPALGDGLEVIMGGGRRYFTPVKASNGRRR